MVWEAWIIGALQGLTEFLPVSSSAHLTVVPRMLGWNSELLNSLTFDVALHLGTLLALLVYFWKDWRTLLGAWLTKGWSSQAFQNPQARLAWWIILGTLPAVMAGIFLEDRIETQFRSPLLIAACLMGVGLLMWAAERFSKRARELESMSPGEALFIGIAQALALIPGVSRSGITLTAGLAAGFKREEAARFSFLLSMPIVAGACIFKIRNFIYLRSAGEWIMILSGTVAAAVVGAVCIHFLLAFLRKHGLYIFVIYRWALGLAICAWVSWR